MRTSSKTAAIDYIYKSVDFDFSIIVCSHMCMQQETYWPSKGFRSDRLTIEQRVKRYALMNNSNCNSASTSYSTILDSLHYVEAQERYFAIK